MSLNKEILLVSLYFFRIKSKAREEIYNRDAPINEYEE